MKHIKVCIGAGLAFCFFIQVRSQAQGTVYLSSVAQPSAGAYGAATDSRLAAGFVTGSNAAGYLLNSVQLAMADAAGNPGTFTIMLLANNAGIPGSLPGAKIADLTGPVNPAMSGIYTYTADGITLAPLTFYWIELTAATQAANGTYQWDYSSMSPIVSIDDWNEFHIIERSANDGAVWNAALGYPEFAIEASVAPEPSVLYLTVFAGGISLLVRRAFRR